LDPWQPQSKNRTYTASRLDQQQFIRRQCRKHYVLSLANQQLGFRLVELNSLAVNFIRIFIHRKEKTTLKPSQMHPDLTLRPVDRLGLSCTPRFFSALKFFSFMVLNSKVCGFLLSLKPSPTPSKLNAK
jgi:hypothetical protein